MLTSVSTFVFENPGICVLKSKVGLKCVKRYSPKIPMFGVIIHVVPTPAFAPTEVSVRDWLSGGPKFVLSLAVAMNTAGPAVM